MNNNFDFIFRINYDITIKKPKTDEDKDFIEKCCLTDDFKLYIPNEYEENYNIYLVIKNKDKNIGIFNPNIMDLGVSKISVPIFYLLQRKNVKSFMALCSIVNYVFNTLNVDRIEIRVYSHNKQMLSIMNHGIFVYEGCLKYRYKINDLFVDMYFYSLLKKEYNYAFKL